jgi:hypothetical protein
MTRLIFCALTFIAPLLLAQTNGAVEGRIIDSAGHAGIDGVVVTLSHLSPGNPATYRATTNSAGDFRLTGIPDDTYTLELSSRGYGDRSPVRDWRPFRVPAGETVRLSMEMVPLAILHGRVVDEAGLPVGKAKVELAHIRGGSAELTTTDVDGHFELSGSGTFTLMARPGAKLETRAGGSGGGERTVQTPVYFPQAIRRSEAVRIDLRPGRQVNNLELRLRELPAHRIRGTVMDERGNPAAGAQVDLISPDQWNAAAEAQVLSGQDGAFEFDSAWARDWELTARTKRGGVILRGYSSAVLSDQDVTGVVIRVSPPFTVTATVELPGPRKDKPAAGTSVWLFAEGSGENRSGGQQTGGTVQIKDVHPGRYTIAPATAPSGYYLESVFLGERDVTGQPVDLLDGSAPIRVIFAANPARVRGTVAGCRGQTVVLWNLEAQVPLTERDRRTSCDGSGRFEFSGLRPGEYHACAFASVGDPYLLSDPAFARSVNRCATVQVEKGQTADVELTLLPWPE